MHEVADHFNMITWHHHFLIRIWSVFWESQVHSDISSSHKRLRPVVLHERRVTATLIFGQYLSDDAPLDSYSFFYHKHSKLT